MQGRLVHRALIAEQTAAFWFQPDEPFEFKAGQTCDITIPQPPFRDDAGATRTFSIASAPGEPRLMVGTRLRGSAMKRSLMEAPLGLPVEIDGPYGSFTLHRNAQKSAVLLAGGIGITPFRSMVDDATRRRLPHQITLVYANSTAADVAWLMDFECWAQENPSFRLVATISEGRPGDAWTHETGRVDADFLRRHLQTTPETMFYVAGPDRFVKAMLEALPGVGADPDNIRSEEFPGY